MARVTKLIEGDIEWTRVETVANRAFDATEVISWTCRTRLTGRKLTLIQVFGDIYLEFDHKREDLDPIRQHGWNKCYERLETKYEEQLLRNIENDPFHGVDPFYGGM